MSMIQQQLFTPVAAARTATQLSIISRMDIADVLELCQLQLWSEPAALIVDYAPLFRSPPHGTHRGGI